jgi:hypothetical protein
VLWWLLLRIYEKKKLIPGLFVPETVKGIILYILIGSNGCFQCSIAEFRKIDVTIIDRVGFYEYYIENISKQCNID